MNPLNLLCDYLAQHGPVLLAGSTCLLALGCAGMLLHRSPIHRQRAGELTVLGALLWATLALVPLPRLSWAASWPGPLFGPRIPADAQSDPNAGIAADAPLGADANVPFRSAKAAPLLGSEGQEEAAFAERKATLVDSAGATAGLPSSVRGTVGQANRGTPRGLRVDPRAGSPGAARSEPSTAGEEGAILGLSAAELPTWLARVYLAGLVACVGWLTLGRVLLQRVLRQPWPPEPWLAALYDGLAPPGRHRPRLLVGPGVLPRPVAADNRAAAVDLPGGGGGGGVCPAARAGPRPARRCLGAVAFEPGLSAALLPPTLLVAPRPDATGRGAGGGRSGRGARGQGVVRAGPGGAGAAAEPAWDSLL